MSKTSQEQPPSVSSENRRHGTGGSRFVDDRGLLLSPLGSSRSPSRQWCHGVPLYHDEAQFCRLPLHLPYHPLPVGRLIHRQALRHIRRPVLQQRINDPRQFIRRCRNGLRQSPPCGDPPKERPQRSGSAADSSLPAATPVRPDSPRAASRWTSAFPQTSSGSAPGRANSRSASHSATDACPCRSHSRRRGPYAPRSPR